MSEQHSKTQKESSCAKAQPESQATVPATASANESQTREAQIAAVLLEAANIVERGWCQEWYAKDEAGYDIGDRFDDDEYVALEQDACRWCAVGAITKAAGRNDVIGDRATAVVSDLINSHLPSWNDTPGRTASEVAAKLREAAALAAQEINHA